MTSPALVIFDCDGVLIDSELLSCEAEAACLAAAGLDVSLQEVLDTYVGISLHSMVAALQVRFGRRVPPDLADRIRAATHAAFEGRLQPVAGIVAALDRLDLPACVASGSEPARLAHTLGLAGLWDRFAPHVFSATQVERGKPAPDLFLFAADRMGAAPETCVVVEDSVAGIQAARAAGMRALGFTGASHCGPRHAERLYAAGADTVFDTMSTLDGLLRGSRADHRPGAH
ncbi:MAG: HAD family hydrolase [Rhodospirillales bacterium]|nr:HAD family hydrolase [Rhodospirillales bacterium]